MGLEERDLKGHYSELCLIGTRSPDRFRSPPYRDLALAVAGLDSCRLSTRLGTASGVDVTAEIKVCSCSTTGPPVRTSKEAREKPGQGFGQSRKTSFPALVAFT